MPIDDHCQVCGYSFEIRVRAGRTAACPSCGPSGKAKLLQGKKCIWATQDHV